MLARQITRDQMPNTFAYIMIVTWPVLALVAFRKLPITQGAAAAMLFGMLLLPEKTAIRVPVMPDLDKSLSIGLAGLLLVLAAPKPIGAAKSAPSAIHAGWLPRAPWILACFAGLIIGELITALLNPDPLIYVARYLPGMTTYDAASNAMNVVVSLLPFLIAYKTLATPTAHKQFLQILVVAGAIYCIPTLMEVRLSPQLHRLVYGFLQHSWLQHVRGDGFRPIVFMEHGLWVSLFFAITFLAAVAAVRNLDGPRRPWYIAMVGVLFVTLVLTKSLGALMIAMLFAPIIYLAPIRVQLLVAVGVTVGILVYPVLRGNNLVPVDQILDIVGSADPERAQSFGTRIENEDQLLAKANERPLFGWGGWGRYRIFDEYGRDLTRSDGIWAILIGSGGWVRYLSTFGLLCIPILLTALQRKTVQPSGTMVALILLLAANLVDLIPNAGLTPLTWMVAGALAGRLAWKTAEAPQAQSELASDLSEADPLSPQSTTTGALTAQSPYAPVLRSASAAPPPRTASTAKEKQGYSYSIPKNSRPTKG